MADLVVLPRADGRWAWRLRADNGDIIATDGGQGYENQEDCGAMADRIVRGEFKDARRMRVEKK